MLNIAKMRIFLFLLFVYKFFYAPVTAQKAKDFDFVFIDESYSFTGNENRLFSATRWVSRDPSDYEFIFLHLAYPIYITHIVVIPPEKNLILYTLPGGKILPHRKIYKIDGKPANFAFVYNTENKTVWDVRYAGGSRKLEMHSNRFFIDRIYFLNGRRVYPVFVLRRPQDDVRNKFVDLTGGLVTGLNRKYFYGLKISPQSYDLYLAYRKDNLLKGTRFRLSDSSVGRKNFVSKLWADSYFISFKAGKVMYRIPDSALVSPVQMDTAIKKDIRYATENNFTGQKLYRCAKCYLRYEVAKDLVAAAKDFEDLGYQLVVFDCYRPVSVQKRMWQVYPDINYVAPPSKGSMHNRGVAVDVSLAKDGRLVDMGTGYDYFGKKAFPGYKHLQPKERYYRKLLSEVMQLHGFHPIKTEWWHFYHKSFYKYKPLDIDICND